LKDDFTNPLNSEVKSCKHAERRAEMMDKSRPMATRYPPHIQDLANYPREYLTAAQIAKIVGKDANTLRHMARYMPERLPFPCIANPEESTVRFPKLPFLAAYGYQA
jgi:hypothetical protein